MQTPFSPRLRLHLITQGGVLFMLGLVVGLLFTFVILGRVEVWPLVPRIEATLPGSEAAWRRAHLGLMFNAIALLVFAGLAGALHLGLRAQRVYAVCVSVTAWGNSAGFVLAALTSTHGLHLGDGPGNSLTYLCFLVAALTAFVQGGLLVLGARRAMATG